MKDEHLKETTLGMESSNSFTFNGFPVPPLTGYFVEVNSCVSHYSQLSIELARFVLIHYIVTKPSLYGRYYATYQLYKDSKDYSQHNWGHNLLNNLPKCCVDGFQQGFPEQVTLGLSFEKVGRFFCIDFAKSSLNWMINVNKCVDHKQTSRNRRNGQQLGAYSNSLGEPEEKQNWKSSKEGREMTEEALQTRNRVNLMLGTHTHRCSWLMHKLLDLDMNSYYYSCTYIYYIYTYFIYYTMLYNLMAK